MILSFFDQKNSIESWDRTCSTGMNIKGKILIISGNTDLQEACRQALCSENLFVQLCDSVHQGVEKARQEEIDIILLDGEILYGQ